MSGYRRGFGSSNGVLLIAFVLALIASRSCEQPRARSSRPSRVSTPVRNPIEERLAAVKAGAPREGIVAAVLVDTSGSMKEPVRDTDGSMRPKIEIARRAALNLVHQFDTYAREHSDKTVFLGIYEFSDRRRAPPCRAVVKLGAPDPAAAEAAISRMIPEGGTPIGDAMIVAKRDIDATGLTKRHILVLTDGENTQGYAPADVTAVIAKQPESAQASIYFVAFDVAASKFNSVRDSGGLVLAASNETDLKSTLDYLLTGKILAEQPTAR